MPTLPQALNWRVTASLDIVTAMFEARYPGEWTLADFAGGVTLRGGYKNADGAVELVDIFTSGIIDSVRVVHAPTGPITEVKGRDAGYTLTDNIALIQFLSQDALRSPVLPLQAPLHGGIDRAERRSCGPAGGLVARRGDLRCPVLRCGARCGQPALRDVGLPDQCEFRVSRAQDRRAPDGAGAAVAPRGVAPVHLAPA